jgi:4-amino-4-deoxy-L-arabinose transferase-like glycosyltransferase
MVISGGIYSFYLGNIFQYHDEADYYNLANNLVLKRSFSLNGEQPTAYRPPAYPFFLTPFIGLGWEIVHLRLLNFFALGGCLLLLYGMLKRQYSPLTGLLAGALILFYPVLFYAAGTLYPQTIASVLFLLILFMLARTEVPAAKIYLYSGLLAGLLILMIPNFLFPLFVLIIWISFYHRSLSKLFIFLLGILLLVGIWTARNYFVFERFVFISTNSGFNLLLGNSENATPNSGGVVDIRKYEESASSLSEIEKDAYYRSRAIEFILSHKWHSLKLYGLKILNYFNWQNELQTKEEASWLGDLIMFISYGTLLSLFLYRLLKCRTLPLDPFERLLTFIYVSNAFYQAIFFTRIRFRLPFEYLLIAMAAIFIAKLKPDLLPEK